MINEPSPLGPATPQISTTPSASPPIDLSRRGFLRGAVLAGGGVVAATVVACTPGASAPAWSYGPVGVPAGTPAGSGPAATPVGSMGHGASPAASHEIGRASCRERV